MKINDELPYVPQFQGGVVLGYAVASYQFFVQSVYQSERRSVSGSGTADLPASWVHNVGTSYTYKHWTFKLSIQNALNSEHVVAARPAGYRLYAPRMILGTLVWSL